jgi:hypothetical protein
VQRHYALSFEPSVGGDILPADAFVAALAAAVDGLVSVRNAAAPVLADQRGWPVGHVRECLAISFAPLASLAQGSLVVPVVIGARGGDLDSAHLAATFWRMAGRMVKSAARSQPSACEISSVGAESFAKAANAASDGGAKLRLVHRASNAARWMTTADLTVLERPLRAYAARRQSSTVARAQMVGQLATLSAEPPTLTLLTPSGRRAIRLPDELRDAARAHWGQEVLVDVEAVVTMEGDVRDPTALAIRAVPQRDDTFDETRGAAREAASDVVEGGPLEYVEGLKRRGHV